MNKKQFGLLRICFGLVYLVDAIFKWQPAFLNNFSGYLSSATQGQPRWIVDWINLWIKIISPNPHLFAVIIAVLETLIALALIFGWFTRQAIVVGILLCIGIWTTAEGFGGPYTAGATDIGSAIIYVFVFLALWFGRSWEALSWDRA